MKYYYRKYEKSWQKKREKKIANIRNKIFHFVIFFTVTSIICLFILKQFGYFQIWSHVAVTTNPKWKSRTSNGAYNEKPRGRFRSHTVDIERRMPIGSLSTLESSSFYSSFAATPLSLFLRLPNNLFFFSISLHFLKTSFEISHRSLQEGSQKLFSHPSSTPCDSTQILFELRYSVSGSVLI